jgi:hypothetical protein
MSIEQRLAELEARVSQLEKEAAAATTAEIMAQGNYAMCPEKFKALLDNAPTIDLKSVHHVDSLFEPIKPYNVSKEFDLDEC